MLFNYLEFRTVDKVLKLCCSECCTTPSSEFVEERNALFQLTRTRRIPHTSICYKSDADTIRRSPRPTYKAVTSKGTSVTSASRTVSNLLRNYLGQPSDQNIADCSLLVSYCRMMTPGHILRVWQLRRPGAFRCLPHFAPRDQGHSRRLLVKILSDPMKYGRWYMSGYACSQRIFLTRLRKMTKMYGTLCNNSAGNGMLTL